MVIQKRISATNDCEKYSNVCREYFCVIVCLEKKVCAKKSRMVHIAMEFYIWRAVTLID